MEAFFALSFFLLGAIIGSFLNVVSYRFHTNRGIGGRSHCMSCGHTLSWYELVPLFSYVLQLGRCRACNARISGQYFMVELLTGALFALVYLSYVGWVHAALSLAVMAALVLIVVYDMRHTIIPDELVVALCILALALFAASAVGQPLSSAVGAFGTSVLGALVASGFFAGLWLISRGRWIGLGDAKLAIPLGFMVGWPAAISLVVFAFWIGAIVSVGLLALRRALTSRYVRGKLTLRFISSPLTMKSEVPFAPFLIASFILVSMWGIDVLTATEVLFGL